MKRLLKIAGALVALVLVAAVGLAIWVAWFFDANAYRQQIVEQARQYTGRELKIEGDLSVDFLPRIALQSGPLSLAARPGFGEAPMLAADGVSMAMQLWPLLDGEFLVDHVVVESPRLSLGIDADGESAWGDIVARVQQATGHGADASDGEALGAGVAALVVQGVEIRDGSLRWHDGRDDTSLAVNELSLDVDRIRSGEPGRFDIAARIESPDLSAPLHVAAGGRVTADFETLDADIADLAVEAASEAFDATLSAAAVTVRGAREGGTVRVRDAVLATVRSDDRVEAQVPDAVYDAAADSLSVPVIRIEGAGLSAQGEASATSLSSMPSATLHIQTDRLDAGEFLGALGLTQRLTGRGDLELDLAGTGLDADALAASLDGRVDVNLADGLVRGIDIGRILAAARAGDAAAAATPPAGEPVTRFTRFDASMQFEDGIGRSRDLALVADGFRVDGEGTVNLPANRVDYRLAIYVAEPSAGEGAAPAYEPVPVPLRISGNLDRPDIDIDFQALMKAEAERQLQREARERGIDAPDAKSAVREYLQRKLGESLD